MAEIRITLPDYLDEEQIDWLEEQMAAALNREVPNWDYSIDRVDI